MEQRVKRHMTAAFFLTAVVLLCAAAALRVDTVSRKILSRPFDDPPVLAHCRAVVEELFETAHLERGTDKQEALSNARLYGEEPYIPKIVN